MRRPELICALANFAMLPGHATMRSARSCRSRFDATRWCGGAREAMRGGLCA